MWHPRSLRDRKTQLLVLLGTCSIVCVLAFFWWIANLNATVTYATGSGEHPGLDTNRSMWVRILFADVTTASPLMVLSTFAFPLIVYVIVRKRQDLPGWLASGYPESWKDFLIWVGLAATLFGMLVALSAVGTDGTREQLTRLIAGTSTALVSSLVALVAAFSAHVLQAAMGKLELTAGAEDIGLDDSIVGLKDRVDQLDDSFRGLGNHVGELTLDIERLSVASDMILTTLFEPLNKLTPIIENLDSRVKSISDALSSLPASLSPLADHMSKIGSVLTKSKATQDEQLEELKGLRDIENQQLALLGEHAAAQHGQLADFRADVESAANQASRTRQEMLQVLRAVLDAEQRQLSLVEEYTPAEQKKSRQKQIEYLQLIRALSRTQMSLEEKMLERLGECCERLEHAECLVDLKESQAAACDHTQSILEICTTMSQAAVREREAMASGASGYLDACRNRSESGNGRGDAHLLSVPRTTGNS